MELRASVTATALLLPLLLIGCVSPSVLKVSETPPAILDVFPESVVQMPAGKQGKTVFSSRYTPSGSRWGKHLDEATVFHREMKHVQDEENSFVSRVGKGGQLYSLRGPFGESLPPQGLGNPWNDEVWQFVAVCTKYNGADSLTRAGAVDPEVSKRVKGSPYANWYFIHNSGAYMQAPVDSGLITLSFDVRLDEDKPGELTCMLRDRAAPPWRTFGNLEITERGISFNGTPIAPARAGAWYSFELAFELKESGTSNGTVTARGPDGQGTVKDVAFAEAPIHSFEWLGFSASGTDAGVFFLDNLSVKRVAEGRTEWLADEDFEDYEPGSRVLYTAGADEAKGAISFVSDRFAAAGQRSLEVHDAAGLAANWQPMVKLGVQSHLGGALYCPLLGEATPHGGRTFRTVNWGFVPQLKTVHRSPLLYYVQTRDVGDGVIEITYVVHNFSARDDIVFDWLNAPWGGTRVTSLPYHFVASPEGELWDMEKIEELNIKNGRDVRQTGGWNLSCATQEPDSPSLALVFGRDKHLEAETARAQRGEPHCQFAHSIYRDWTSRFPGWEKRPEHTWRNYDVAVVIPRFRLGPGTSIWYRSFLVVNRKDRAIELAESLVKHVDYGLRVFRPETTPMVPVSLGRRRDADFRVFTKPVPGTMPLFVIENKTTGRDVVTTDPYIFVPQEKLDYGVPQGHLHHDYYSTAVGYSLDKNNSNWKRLLGYGYKEKPATGNWVQLSTLLPPEQFPESTAYHLDLCVMSK